MVRIVKKCALVYERDAARRDELLLLLKALSVRVISISSPSSASTHLKDVDIIFTEKDGIPSFAGKNIPLIAIGEHVEHEDVTASIVSPTQALLETLLSAKSESLIAKSKPLKEVLAKAKKVSMSDANVFIFGESGTGKEVVATYIRNHSTRKNTPFIRVNCAAIPENLLESEFFGHEKGAFTGAHTRRLGRFELANKGTLLLDEVTEIPKHLQAKLLRAVQEQEFERVGGTESIKVNVRIIATSNQNRDKMLLDGTFRKDLYYRLGVVPLFLPPLRERADDIEPLAHHFVLRSCEKNGFPKKRLTPCALTLLSSYNWPGNVRELANVIEHAVVLSDSDEISKQHLPLPIHQMHTKQFEPKTLREVEDAHILQTLAYCNGNKTKTASLLGISVRTLRSRLAAIEKVQKG